MTIEAIKRNLAASWPLALLLLLSAYFRLNHIYHGAGFHPDERHMVFVAEKLSRSDLNPHSFAYGSLPYYLLWILSSIFGVVWEGARTYDGLFIVGRILCAGFGLIGIWATYRLAENVYGDKRISLLAATILGLNTFHIQLSRFYTVDVVLTTFITLGLWAAVSLADKASWPRVLTAIVIWGAALATKISASFLVVPIGIGLVASQVGFSWPPQITGAKIARLIGLALAIGLAALVVFVCLEPFAIIDRQEFLRQITEQTEMVKGKWRPPYTIQYMHTLPYLYPLSQMWQWTLGWPVALTCLLGLTAAGWRLVRRFSPKEAIITLWVIVFFFAIAGFQVKFPRYLMPIYPALFILAAKFLVDIAFGVGRESTPISIQVNLPSVSISPRQKKILVFSLSTILVAGLALWSIPKLWFLWQKWNSRSMFEATVGKAPGKFESIRDLDIAPSGRVAVCDALNHRIQVFDPQGELVLTTGSFGTGLGQLNEPHAVAFGPNEDMYVLDTWNSRIAVYDKDGNPLRNFTAPDGLFGPRAVALRGDKLYVTDSGHSRIVVLSIQGSFVMQMGSLGEGWGQLKEPVGIAVTEKGEIWVADSGNNRLVVYDATGKPHATINVSGWTGDGLKEAYLDVDEHNQVYLTDPLTGVLWSTADSTQPLQEVAAGPGSTRGLAVRGDEILVSFDNHVERLRLTK